MIRWFFSGRVCVLLCAIALLTGFPALLLSSAGAQEAKKPDDTVVLTPFVVSTAGDVGYVAQNSVSGSRLNTKLSDLAAPTTAFTVEFLEDVASTSVDDLYKYMVNTQVEYSETSAVNQFYADDRRNASIRGLPGGRNSINYFASDLRLDHYHTERIDFSRGANSILFGMGSPGGVVNVSTKRARFNESSGSLTLQGRSWDGIRAVLDYNQPLLKDRLSLRLAAVRDKRDSWRTNEWNDQNRLYLTARWKPTPKTIVDVEFEHGLVTKLEGPSFVANDAYTLWANAGKQRYTSGAFNAAAGIRNISNNNYLVIDLATGVAMDWRGKANTVPRNVEGTNAMLSDFNVVPKHVSITGPGFPQNTNYTRHAAFVTHAFTPKLNMEIAATNDRVSRYVYQGTAAMASLQADPNVTLPNGQPNPNVGRAYFEGEPTQTHTYTTNGGARATLSYEHDLGRIFGRHSIAGLVGHDWQHYRKRQDRLAMVVNPYNTTAPENASNLPKFRTYVDLDGPAENIVMRDWRKVPLERVTDTVTGRQVGIDWINQSPAGAANNRFKLYSQMAVLQSRWFGDRLITVFGLRRDQQDAWYSRTAVRNPPFGAFAVGDYEVKPGADNSPTSAQNKTAGLVYHVFRGFSLTYNYATNTALPNPVAALPNEAGGRAPNPNGRSQDYGFKIDLGQRLYLTASYFESSAQNDFINGTQGVQQDNFNQIWNALAAARVALPGGKTAGDYQTRANGITVDSVSHGYEVELVANPTPNWRLFVNFSDNTMKQTNLGRDARTYLAKYRDFWLEGTNGRVLLDDSGRLAPVANDGTAVIDTVAKAVAQVETGIQSAYILPDGNRPRGQIQYQGNLRTNYSFTQGPLKGWSTGGGLRMQSGRVTNYDLSTRAVKLGRAISQVDYNLGYRFRRKLGSRDGRWSLQLNINNLLNDTRILPMRTAARSDDIITYRVQTPREFIGTARLDF